MVEDLAVAYPRPPGPPLPALRSVSFRLAPGEALGVTGASGSGKSTLALALTGLLPPAARLTARRLDFGGESLLGLGDNAWQRRRGAVIGCVLQQPFLALSPWRRVGDQLTDVLRAHRPLAAREAQISARELLEQLGLGGELASAFPHQLSGGQRQRIVFCQAVAAGPRLLVADEPTASLDEEAAGRLLEFVASLRRKLGLSLLWISHDEAVLARVADRVLVLCETARGETAPAAPRAASPLPPLVTAEEAPVTVANDLGVALGRGRFFERRRRREELLRNVDFALRPGEVVGLHGPSGSGKTTLLRCLAGLLSPTSGRVAIGGEDPWAAGELRRRQLRRRVQLVGQDPVRWADPRWPLWRIVAEGLASRPAAPTAGAARQREAAAAALAEVGLGEELLERRPAELSGGQLQRALLARAIADRGEDGARALLLDEAFSALDPGSRERLLALALELRERHALALLCVSHQIGWLRSFCSRLVAMEAGRLL